MIEQTQNMTSAASKTVNYAHWEQQWLQSDEYINQLNYWRQQLANAAPLLELPSDRSRPSVQTYNSDRFSFELSQDLILALESMSQQQGVTLYITLLTAFKTLLYRYTRQSDIIVGSPFNVKIKESDCLFNTLVLRTNVAGDLSFQELLTRVQKVTTEAYAHGKLSFARLVEEIQLEKDSSYNPLFQVMFALQKQLSAGSDVQNSSDRNNDININRHCSMLDLSLDLTQTDASIYGHLEYNTDLFDRDTIARMVGHWQTLLTAVVANPQARIAHLPLLTITETQTFLDWNQIQDYPVQKTSIQQLFEAQVKLTPDAVAVEFNHQQLTYQQINQKANQLAHHLQSLGVGSDVLVGICLERSLEMIVGLLGILKAGGAYVPLDPNYPEERLAYMVEDAKISVLLTQDKWKTKIPGNQAQIVNLDLDWSEIATHSPENPQIITTGKHLAYVIYTSGSTGKPKGVMITHQGLSTFVRSAIQVYQITQSDRILQFASINFDAAVEEIFSCLAAGATLVLRTDAMLTDLETFFQACEDLKLSVLGLPTAYWHQLAAELKTKDVPCPEFLRLVVIGGEAVMPEPVKNWQKYVHKSGKSDRLQLFNSYGPTEVTVVATMYPITATTSWLGEVPIGKPYPHLQAYIFDQNQQLVPIGVPGELHIGGDSLARGYLNRPELTQEKFIPNPFLTNISASVKDSYTVVPLVYKTGDLARYLPNGEIEYLGRIDNQVKIRGFRIELGEIEAVLTQHPNISEVAVSVNEDESHNKRLIAYIVTSSEILQSQEVRSFLQDRLPNYMMPSAFVFLKAMPLTPNGKLDRRALPTPDITSRPSNTELVLPTNDVEQKLVKIWAQVLGIDSIGIQDNFFELGGHSLLAVQLFGEIESQFNRKFPLTVLFEAPTIEQLAIRLQASPKTIVFDSIVKLKSGNSQTPLFLVHDAAGETILYAYLANHLKPEQTVYGIRPYSSDLNIPMLKTRISEIAENYVNKIRQVQPQGPYLIGGLCAGGVLAFEIACRLQAEGEQVPLVAIIDAISPQGIGQNYQISVNQKRKKRFMQAFKRGQKTCLKSLVNLLKIVLRKGFNLVSYEVSTKAKKYTNNLRIKLLRYCLDRQLTIPKFCQNIPLRSIYIYAESDYARDKPSIYQGQLTLWRATEKLDLSNPAIDDTPAIFEVKDPLFGWSKQATQGVIAHDIPGGHSSMLQEPNVQTMAQKLQLYIDSIVSN
jgi:amino acid adenylation domain-containing protein